jgi:acyl-CoA synthetase (AMP-forming)/AMP-acid ligase II
MASVLGSLSAGGAVVCAPGFDAAHFWRWLAEFRATWYSAVPAIHQSVLESAQQFSERIVHRSLRFIRSSSSSLPPRIMQELERTFGVPVIESYGMTEAAHQICSNPLPPGRRKPGSVGPRAGPQIAVMDEAGHLLPSDTTGEIVIRGENVTAGYDSHPASHEAAFRSGWLRTGDQGFIDVDGYVFLTGRFKEMINRGGEKVSPRDTEEALLEHPAVARAVSFAVPHASLGEDLAAAVVLHPDRSATESELRHFALSRLPGFKVPSRVVFVEHIPQGPSGKPQRTGLHRRLAHFLRPPYAAPATPVEEVVAGIWSEVLKTIPIGRGDNFFMLGGDSLSAARVKARLQADLQLELPLDAILRAPTISELAATVDELLLRDIERTAGPSMGSQLD